MKSVHVSLFFFLFLSAHSVLCQTKISNFKPAKVEEAPASAENTITNRRIIVAGYAEKEVTPDIIYVSMIIKEYFSDNAQKQKMFLEDLEKDFLRKVYDAGIKPAAISIEGFSGQINSTKHKKNDQFLASKRYLIKMSDLDRMNSLVASFDPKAITGVYINRYEYSRMEDVKKELRIKALQDARQRALSMLSSLDESLGEPLLIEEAGVEEPVRPFMNTFQARSEENASPEINFQKIKLNASVKVVFKIK